MNPKPTREDLQQKIQEAREKDETPDLSGYDLSEMDLTGLDLHEVNLRGSNLSSANLRMVDLTKADLSGCDLREADLYGANLNKVHLQGADLSGANLSKAMLYATDLSQATLQGADLSAILLYAASLREANLTGAILHGANLSKSDLKGALLCKADLREATLIETDLSQANAQGCNLNEATLRGATVRATDFAGATLEGTALTEAHYNSATTWPEGFTPPAEATRSEQKAPSPKPKSKTATKFSALLQALPAAKKAILYLHGFASSPQGGKGDFFEEKFKGISNVAFDAFAFTPTPRDFEQMTLTGLINRLRQHLLERDWEEVSLIGSSLGGLVALHYAHQFGGIKKMLLLAPAVSYSAQVTESELDSWAEKGSFPFYHYHFEEELALHYAYHLDGLLYRDPVPPAAPTLIIHGQNDNVVPVQSSRDYVAHFPERTQLIDVDSDHRLTDQLPLIWGYIQSFLLL